MTLEQFFPGEQEGGGGVFPEEPISAFLFVGRKKNTAVTSGHIM